MTRCIVSTIVLALIAAQARGADDLATQIKGVQSHFAVGDVGKANRSVAR